MPESFYFHNNVHVLRVFQLADYSDTCIFIMSSSDRRSLEKGIVLKRRKSHDKSQTVSKKKRESKEEESLERRIQPRLMSIQTGEWMDIPDKDAVCHIDLPDLIMYSVHCTAKLHRDMYTAVATAHHKCMISTWLSSFIDEQKYSRFLIVTE